MTQGRLLVLDDDATVGMLVVMVAQGAGFEARLCETPHAFFEALADWRPSHVSIDLNLPEMSGADVLRQLAARGCQAKVIVSSGASSVDVDAACQLARSLGLTTAGVLPKPFALATLRALLADAPICVASPACPSGS